MMSEPIRECPYCRELVKEGAIKCPRCFTVIDRVAYLKESLGGFGVWLGNRLEWSSRQRGRRFLGVCAALASRSRLPAVAIRALFVALTLTGHHGLLIYLLIFLFFPEEGQKAEILDPPGRDEK